MKMDCGSLARWRTVVGVRRRLFWKTPQWFSCSSSTTPSISSGEHVKRKGRAVTLDWRPRCK
jgi:hypothetical protein